MEPMCTKCPLRKKHDRNPGSLLGKFWRWHINFCPGWKKYLGSLDQESLEDIKKKYSI